MRNARVLSALWAAALVAGPGAIAPVCLGQAARGVGGVVSVPVGGQPKVVYEESHALVVGINRYPDHSAFRSLTFAVADAEAVRDLLVGVYGFPRSNVTLLTDETDPQPTRQAILDGLTRLSQVRKRQARVVFYFSGHGQTADIWSGKAGFLVPADAGIPRNQATDAGLLDAKCVPMAQVKRKLTICQARHRLLLLDACFSGLAVSGRSALKPAVPDYLRKVAFTPVLKVLVAGQAGEEVFEKPEWGHGAFTKRLLDVLRPNDAGAVIGDMNGDGYVTTDELWSLVPTTVREMTGGKQNPKDAQEGDGEVLFVTGNTSGPPAPPKPDDNAWAKRLAEIKRQQQERRRREQKRQESVAKARTTFESVKTFDADDGLAAAKKAELWQAYLKEFEASGHEVAYARERLEHWRKYREPAPGPRVQVPAGQTWTNPKDGSEMIYVPAGTFEMGEVEILGRELMVHDVHVDAFYIGKYEVTNKQFKKFLDANPQWSKRHVAREYTGEENHPVDYVTWFAAKAYCEWAGGRLPTEAEWEKACRAGSSTKYCCGDTLKDLSKYAWYSQSSGRDIRLVGSLLPNAWGIYDMHGNIREWTSSLHKPYPYKASDGREDGNDTVRERVVRGGSWSTRAEQCRSAHRLGAEPTETSTYMGGGIGLRLCVSYMAPSARLGQPKQEPRQTDAEPKPALQHGKTWTNPKDGSEMVYVPAGTFEMGSSETWERELMVHDVHVDAFYIGKYEVTNKQFKKFVDANPQWSKRRVAREHTSYLIGWPGKENHPVDYVTWLAAKAYCEWAGGRLPTEAEWEKACGAGSNTKYCFGDTSAELCKYAWDRQSSGGRIHLVGSLLPNAWGIYDMHGNMQEWTSSLYKPYPYRADDGREDANDAVRERVVRGGSWKTSAEQCRSAYRFGAEPNKVSTFKGGGIGFRLRVAATEPR